VNGKLAIVAGLLVCGAISGGPACGRGARHAEQAASPSALTDTEKHRIRSFWTIYNKAQSLKLAGEWQAAIAEYLRALELDPKHEDTLYNLANCHFEMDRFGEAIGYLKRLVETNPISQRGFLQLGVIHACPGAGRSFDLHAAEAALRRAFEINQEETGAILRLGEVALVRGEADRAYELFAKANRSNDRALEAWYMRAYIRWKDGSPEESRDLLMKAVQAAKEPLVVAKVPGEGDTKAGSNPLLRSTVAEKRLVKALWSGLPARHPGETIDPASLASEFTPLDEYLADLRSRIRPAKLGE
jgi:tetratricopeptide (TPR) repeat protein